MTLMLAGLSGAADCVPPKGMCDDLKAQAAVSKGMEFEAGFNQAKAAFRSQKGVTYAELSQGLVDGAQRLAMGCELVRSKQLSCRDWEQLKIDTGLQTAASIGGSWSIRYLPRGVSPARSDFVCSELGELAETWQIEQSSGGTVEVKVKTQRSLEPLTKGKHGGSFEQATLRVLADSRFGRCSCQLPVDGTVFKGECECTEVWKGQPVCHHRFGANGMKLSD